MANSSSTGKISPPQGYDRSTSMSRTHLGRSHLAGRQICGVCHHRFRPPSSQTNRTYLDDEHQWQQCASIDIWAESEESPRFSRDGKSLLMISSRDGGPNLYVLPLEGGEAKRLTNISTGIADPLWSPDGKWIAFSTDVYAECGDDDACNQKAKDTWSNGPLKAHIADSLLYRH